MNLAHKHEPPQAEVVQFPKQERQAMAKDKFDKGYVMVSRLYHNEVRPFLSQAAKDVYTELNARITGFNKSSDFVSYSQLQGDKDLVGSNLLGRATVAKGIKELLDHGVISILETSKKLGNKFQINEVSLVEKFRNKTSSETKLVQLVNQDSSASEPLGSSASEHTIDIIYRYISIDIFIKSLRSVKPLEANFYHYPIFVKQQKAKAEAERKEKARKLSYDEVIKLTSDKFQSLCDLSLWEQFVSLRSQLSKTRLTKNALNTIHKDFKEWGYDGSNQSLKTSITGNYQGLFEPKKQNSGHSTTSTRWNEIQELIELEEAGHEQYGF